MLHVCEIPKDIFNLIFKDVLKHRTVNILTADCVQDTRIKTISLKHSFPLKKSFIEPLPHMTHEDTKSRTG